MNVSRIGTFRLDDENLTGFFVHATIDELKQLPFNPLLATVELKPPQDKKKDTKYTNSDLKNSMECIESLVNQFGDNMDKCEWEGIKKRLNEPAQRPACPDCIGPCHVKWAHKEKK